MHKKFQIPELTLPRVKIGINSYSWDMRRLLYIGGAEIRHDLVADAIDRGTLGTVSPERLDLVRKLHAVIAGKLTAGGSQETTKTQLQSIREFFRWADRKNYTLSLPTAQVAYIHWTDALFHCWQVTKTLAQRTAYTKGRVVGQLLDHALGRTTPMIELTRLKEPKRRKAVQTIQSDKQCLESAFAFGRLLQDICDGMTLSAIWGPRPVRIPLQSGGELVQWAGMHSMERGAIPRTPYREQVRLTRMAARQAAYENKRSLRSRATLINLRILAELLMFIGQTGMNVSQASGLEFRHFSYSSDIDSYKVRDYKSRRGGEVLFEIFKEYRSHFERYLEWRRTLFSDDSRLFPLLRYKGAHEESRPYFGLIIQACKDADVAWQPPSMLRSTRVNWLLRRSGDPDLTAEMAQHHKQTLLTVYEIPSLQRAVGEITRFWSIADPMHLQIAPKIAVAPGACDGVPSALPFKPKLAPPPDCIYPSGCLWCEHHRDIDSLDYVWALSCFRHLKVLEVSRYHAPVGVRSADHPGYYAISRISDKLAWFRDSNTTRRAWVEEALARVEEGNYHPEWCRLIESVEGASE
ncbi:MULTISPECIES: site-specific integrase [unclassified Pseudomonas]|uniref:site-specific integrase n=1 Tax=unclassified Pseudomonas TaxID=196821 RepID=UPI0011AF667D|nr:MULTISPECIES: site-specific integrase [unclassified Pseudomonas]